jgi:hypothetical protein
MDDSAADFENVRQNIPPYVSISRVNIPKADSVGGAALPHVLHLITMASSCEITVVSDTDAFMLAPAWDTELLSLFVNPKFSLFGINPRHSTHGHHFFNVMEWNWFAFRTNDFFGFKPEISTAIRTDWGSCFQFCAQKRQLQFEILQKVVIPQKGKAPLIVGNSKIPFWVMHLFYGSRHRNEDQAVKQQAREWGLTATQLAAVHASLTNRLLLAPSDLS